MQKKRHLVHENYGCTQALITTSDSLKRQVKKILDQSDIKNQSSLMKKPPVKFSWKKSQVHYDYLVAENTQQKVVELN